MKNIILNYLTLLIILIAIPLLIIEYLKTDVTINIFTYLGLLLIIPAIIFFTIARIQLGKSFQISAEANTLVTTGMYKRFRHPVYYFGLIFLLGAILFFQFFYLIIIWGIMIFMQTKRIKKEEKVLEEKFGEQYLDYKRKTWF
jgi:protein-S-isoprenylcysteine O-methyltransferase Ste14